MVSGKDRPNIQHKLQSKCLSSFVITLRRRHSDPWTHVDPLTGSVEDKRQTKSHKTLRYNTD